MHARNPEEFEQTAEQARLLFVGAFAKLDQEILSSHRWWGLDDGATALTVVHTGGFLFVANAGDCRAVLCRNGAAIRLTYDHKPHAEPERRRIVANGGLVKQVGCGSCTFGQALIAQCVLRSD